VSLEVVDWNFTRDGLVLDRQGAMGGPRLVSCGAASSSMRAPFVPTGLDLAHALLDLRDDGGNRPQLGATLEALDNGVIGQGAIDRESAAAALRAPQNLLIFARNHSDTHIENRRSATDHAEPRGEERVFDAPKPRLAVTASHVLFPAPTRQRCGARDRGRQIARMLAPVH
jgi:hypothetical protein